MKGAASGFEGRVGDCPGDAVEPFSLLCPARKGLKKRLGIGMSRVVKNRLSISLFGDDPGIHHVDPIGDLRDHVQIVSDI